MVVGLEGAMNRVWLHKNHPLIIMWGNILLTIGGSQSVAFHLLVQLTKKTFSIFHWALFVLDLLRWSPLFEKFYPWDILGFFSMYSVNLRVISTLVIQRQWQISAGMLENSIKNCLQWPHKHENTIFTCLPSALHLFYWDWNHQITLARAGRRDNIKDLKPLETSFSDEGSSKYPWWQPVSSDIKQRTEVLFCWAKHSKYFKSFQVNIVLLFYS